MVALMLAVVLECKPVELRPYTVKGNTKRGVSVVVTEAAMTVNEGGKVLFTDEHPPFKVLIASDDGWVATKGPYPSGSVQIAPVKEGATLVTVDPLEHLTADERKKVPETSCGTSWFKGWKNEAAALELEVAQDRAPSLKVRVKPDGTVTR
ncbi:MAG: hypothetical protein JNK82_09610 [Myxococcaceae bacterium]|nr:hypothetical protein [Myxococcaceae bacterium]